MQNVHIKLLLFYTVNLIIYDNKYIIYVDYVSSSEDSEIRLKIRSKSYCHTLVKFSLQ